MKKILTTFLCALVVLASTAQENTSKADDFGKEPGAIIKKEFITIGTVSNARMAVVNYTNLLNNEGVSAIQISTDYYVGAIDADEVDAFAKTIKQLQKTIKTKPDVYTEVSFKTRSGFEAGTYFSEGAWTTYFMLDDNDIQSLMQVTESDLITLDSYISDAKAKMKK